MVSTCYTQNEQKKADMKLELVPVDDLSSEIQADTTARYERMKLIVPEVEWAVHAPYVAALAAP